MMKNKLWLGDWVAGDKMLCKCEGGGEENPRGQGSFTFRSTVAKAAVVIVKPWLTTPTKLGRGIPIERSVVVVLGAVRWDLSGMRWLSYGVVFAL